MTVMFPFFERNPKQGEGLAEPASPEEEEDGENRRLEALLEGVPFALRMMVYQLREENQQLKEEVEWLKGQQEETEEELFYARRENIEMRRFGAKRAEVFNGMLEKQAAEAEELKARNYALRQNSEAAYRVANRAALDLYKQQRREENARGRRGPAGAFRPAGTPRPGDLLRPPSTPKAELQNGAARAPAASGGAASSGSQGSGAPGVRSSSPSGSAEEERRLAWLEKERKRMTPLEIQALGLLTLLEKHLLEKNMRLRVLLGGGRTKSAGEFWEDFRRVVLTSKDGLSLSLLEASGVRSPEELWLLLCLTAAPVANLHAERAAGSPRGDPRGPGVPGVPGKVRGEGEKPRISVSCVDKACARISRRLGHMDPCLGDPPTRRPRMVDLMMAPAPEQE